MKPKALILQARGTNRDFDVCEALTLANAEPVCMPLNDLLVNKVYWKEYQMLILPGGFSYADALGAGKLLAIDMASYFSNEIAEFVTSGKPVIGICNGFQALVRAEILPGAVPILNESEETNATLTFNACGHFECRWVNIMPVSGTCIWTDGLNERITCPIAHGEGNFQVGHQSLLDDLVVKDQIALTYVKSDGTPPENEYPANPNGSIMDIAGICNPAGNVLGLMPHPENHVHFYQHPRWTRGESAGSGLVLFKNGVKYATDL